MARLLCYTALDLSGCINSILYHTHCQSLSKPHKIYDFSREVSPH